MATQMAVLKEYGIKAEVNSGIPYVDEKVYERTLAVIWLDGIAGWWNYKDDLLKYDICSEEQYIKKLKNSVKRHK
jgi:hypothetical protein